MRSRPVTGALALGLAVSLAGTLGLTTAADASDEDGSTSTPAAERSLARAEALVSGKRGPSRDATRVMRQLWSAKDGLSRADAPAAESILNRPTEPDDQLGDYYGDNVTPKRACTAVVCVHWAETGPEAAHPAYAAEVLETVDHVHQTYVEAGYKAPLADDDRGGDDRTDVYLADIGNYAFGYCNTDLPPGEYVAGHAVYAFCVLDNDYAEFGPAHTPTEYMQVTAAHEYFHAVQAAYDWEEDFWLLEATATWVEDEVYDDIDDNVFYLPYGQLGGPSSAGGYPVSGPGVSLDLMNFNAYGNWIFFRYLTEKFPAEAGGLPTLVRDIWHAVDSTDGVAADQYSLEAIDSVLAERGTSLEDQYALFAVENNTPERTYDEGAAYPTPDHAFPTVALSPGRPRATEVITLDHMTSGTGAFTPSDAMGAGWLLDVEVDMQDVSRGSQAAVTVFGTDGAPTRSFVPLDPQGDGAVVLPFSSADVSSVQVTLVNSSDRMRKCDDGTAYACGGQGIDDRLAQKVKVTAFR